MKKLFILMILLLNGCTHGHYPEEYAKYMETHNGKFQYDTLCKGAACIDARQYLADYKLAREEAEPNLYGKNFNKLTNHEHITRSLNQDCFNTLSKLINDNYIGCKTNVQLPELSTEEKPYHQDYINETTITLTNGKEVTIKNKKRPFSRQCAIDFAINFGNIVSYCKTTHWEDNPDTQAYYKELAEDSILQTGLIRPSFSFDQNTPKEYYHKKCNTYNYSCEMELELVSGNFNKISTTEAEWDDNLHRGFEEGKYRNNEFDFELSDESKERIEQIVLQIAKYLFRMAGAPIF